MTNAPIVARGTADARGTAGRPRGSWNTVLSLIAFALVTACTLRVGGVAPQDWWTERGPVVPHDSFPADCSLCHEGGDWRDIKDDFSFDHLAETGVPLEGAHARAECLRCHNDRGPVALFAQRGCAGCHEDAHRGQLGQACDSCHGQADWRPEGQVVEHALTRFPLVGAHAATPCWRCHEGAQVGNFSRADIECITCHAANLAQAQNPDHQAQGWVDRCDRCHIPTSWGGGGFNHGIWPLTGKHAVADCSDCHVGGIYAGTPNQCVDCHLAEYNATSDPDHMAIGIGTDCQTCHGTSSWQGANFPHTGITTNCVACHLADYNATTDPDHVAMGIGTSCENCHSTNTWLGASFDHTGITNGCVNCHLPDYNATTNPNHAVVGFSTSCESCHSTNTWLGASFNHTWFPITSGKHKNMACAQCHQDPNNYMVFTCISCHAHNKKDMDDKHKDEPGYVYASSACYNCHPNGKEP